MTSDSDSESESVSKADVPHPVAKADVPHPITKADAPHTVAKAGCTKLSVGLKEVNMSLAKKGSVCYLCDAFNKQLPAGTAKVDEIIHKGEVWVSYRTKASNTLTDCKRVHQKCVQKLPAATRKIDIEQIQNLLSGDITEELRMALADIQYQLQSSFTGTGGAASSSNSACK